MRADRSEVGIGAGTAPDLLACRIGPALCLHQIGRHRGRPSMRVAHQAKIGLVPRVRWRPGGIKVVGKPRRGEHLMR